MNIVRGATRRNVLKTISGLVIGWGAIGTVQAQSSGPSVTFEDQETDGTEITIAELITDEPVLYRLSSPSNEGLVRGELAGDEHFEDYTLTLDRPANESGEMRFSLYPIDGGSSIASDTATVTVTGDVEINDGIPVTRVESDSDAGFNYPYYLYVPETWGGWDEETAMLVQPNNSGSSTDDFAVHEENTRRQMEGGTARRLADSLDVPLLMPVFPRPRSEPVDWNHYVHQLDRETLQIESGPLERVDRQLLDMIDHAQETLAEESYPVRDEVMLDGFSASGNFSDRFTVLHPERVLSVTAGGLNGMALLPLSEAKGETLDYHVGIADVEDLLGFTVDLDALDSVNQFLYMGAEDTNDTIGYDDAWTSDALESTALEVYGEDMIEDRFPFCQTAYERAGVEAQFRVYGDREHRPAPIQDLVEFHRRSMQGEPVSELGENVRPAVGIEASSADVSVGSTVTFEATGSAFISQEVINYAWQFDDGQSAVGETVSHTYEEPGEYTVTLEAVGSDGGTIQASETVTVGNSAGSADSNQEPATAADATTRQGTDQTTAVTTETEAPGLGVLGAIAGLGSATYLRIRRLAGSGDDFRD